MKNFLLFAFVAAILFGCENNSDCEKLDETSEIKLSAVITTIQADSKTAISGSTASWKDGDKIGLFSPQAISTAVTPPAAPSNNIPYTLSGSTWTPSPLIYWASASATHHFLAYYPYAVGNTASNSVKLPKISVQTGTIDPNFDFLYSKNLNSPGVTKSSDPIALIFTHALALIEFKMNINATLATGTTLTSFVLASSTSGDKLYTTDATGAIDLSTGTITATVTANTATITPGTPPVLSTSSVSVYVLILPGTFTAPNLSININEGGTTAISIPAASLLTTTFAPGSKYTYNVNISRSLINVSNPIITDWTNVSGADINTPL